MKPTITLEQITEARNKNGTVAGFFLLHQSLGTDSAAIPSLIGELISTLGNVRQFELLSDEVLLEYFIGWNEGIRDGQAIAQEWVVN